MDISAQIPSSDALLTQPSVSDAKHLVEQTRNTAVEALILASRPLAPGQAGAGSSYRLQMQVGQDVVEVSARQDFPEGTKLMVRALSPSRIRVEQVLQLPPPRLPAALGEALRASLPRQLSLRDALQQIQTLTREQPGLSSELRAEIGRLLGALPSAESTQQPEGLRHAIRHSGIFLEAALRQTFAGAMPGSRTPAPSRTDRPGSGGTSATSPGTEAPIPSQAPKVQRVVPGPHDLRLRTGGVVAPAALARGTRASAGPNAVTTEAAKPLSAAREGAQANLPTRPAATDPGRVPNGSAVPDRVDQAAHAVFGRAFSPVFADAPARHLAAPVDALLSLLRLIQRPVARSVAVRDATAGPATAATRPSGNGSRTDPASLYDARGRLAASANGTGSRDAATGTSGRPATTHPLAAPARGGDRYRAQPAGAGGGDGARAAVQARAVDRTPGAAHRRAGSSPSEPGRPAPEARAVSDRQDVALDTKARLMALLELLRPGGQWSRAQTTGPSSSPPNAGAQPSHPGAGLYTPRGTLEWTPAEVAVRGPPHGARASDTGSGSSQAATQEGRAEISRAQQIQETLARYVEGALARTRIHQLNSLPESRSTPDSGAVAAWVVELPLARGNGFDSLEMRIEDHGHQSDEEGRPSRIWQVMLRLDVGETGPLHAFLQLAGARLAATLWAERAATLQSARAMLHDLERCLTAEGVEVTRLECIPGHPEAGESRLFDRLLDIRT